MPARSRPAVRWRRIALAAVLAIAALAALTVLAAPPAVRYFGERALAEAGFAEAQITDVGFLRNGIRIGRLRLDAEGRAVFRQIAIRLSWASLKAGRAESVAIAEARLSAAIDAEGTLALPGYRPPVGAPEAAAAPAPPLPVDRIALAAAEIALATPAGPVTLAVTDVGARVEETAVAIAAALEAAHEAGRLAGRLEASVAPARAAIEARLAISEGAAALAGAALEGITGRLELSAAPGRPPEAAVTVEAERSAIGSVALGPLRATGSLTGEQARYALASAEDAAADFDLRGTADLRALSGTLAGGIRFADLAALPGAALAGSATLTADLDLQAKPPYAEGRIGIVADDLAQPGRFENGRLRLAARFSASPERATLEPLSEWTGAALPDPDLLPPALAALRDRAVQLTFVPEDTGDTAAVALEIAAKRASIAGSITARAGEAAVAAAGRVVVRQADGGIAADAEPLALTASALPFGDLALAEARFNGSAALAPGGGWRLAGEGSLRASGAVAGVNVTGGQLDWTGRIEGDGDDLRLIAERCLALGAERLAFGGIALAPFAPPCLAPAGDSPLIRYVAETGALDLALSAVEAPLDLTLHADGSTYPLRGRWPAASLTARLGAAGLESVDLALEDGALRLDEQGVAAGPITGRLELRDGALASGALTLDAIESLRTPALWTPLSLDVTAEPGEGGDATTFEAFLSDRQGILVFEASGTAKDGTGAADLTLYPIRFIPGATEPAALSPALGPLLAEVTGPVAFSGRIAWGDRGIDSGGVLELGPLSAQVAGVPVNGFEGRIALASLIPPATDGPQELRLAAANIGLLLTDGRLRFALRPDARLAVESLDFKLAGGTLSAEPFMLDLSRIEDTRVTLEAEGVDLTQMIRLSGIDGLEGTGTLTGRLPVALTPEGVEITEGSLAALGQGVLRYIPEELPDFLKGDDLRTRMLRQALENFQYETLSLTVAGDVGAEQSLRLRARGANPDFLEGHPVELDLSVEGPLVSVVQSAIGGSGARALERMFREADPGGAPPEQPRPEERRP